MKDDPITPEEYKFSNEEHLDGHFNMAYEAYKALLRELNIKEGQHVLDAGCGTGSFLPWIAEYVGPKGKIHAIDIAADNVSLAQKRMHQAQLQCPTIIEQGDLLNLPYESNMFDAVWCANVSQYFSDDHLEKMIGELIRVTPLGVSLRLKRPILQQ